MATVLVVDDDESLRHEYALVLKKDGFGVETASDGKEALALALKHKPKYILVDIMMPEEGGIWFLKRLKPKATLPGSKILALSNLESPGIRARAIELGADDYRVKVDVLPHDLKGLLESL